MNSILITAKNAKLLADKTLEICKKHEIDSLDIFINTRESFAVNKKTETQSIGIEDIKSFQKKLFLKPIKSSIKACIIHEAQYLTTEAQNALLKTLEEPPQNTLIILTSDRLDSLLPTILSRCKIIALHDQVKLSAQQKEELSKQISDFLHMTITDRLVMAEKLSKNKSEAIIWLENMIIVLREKLIENISNKVNIDQANYAFIVKEFQNMYQLIKYTNINLRLAFENLFIKINED